MYVTRHQENLSLFAIRAFSRARYENDANAATMSSFGARTHFSQNSCRPARMKTKHRFEGQVSGHNNG